MTDAAKMDARRESGCVCPLPYWMGDTHVDTCPVVEHLWRESGATGSGAAL